MDKKTLTTVIVVVGAVIIVGGVFAGINRWRAQRAVNSALKDLYGITGNVNGLEGQVAQQIAKEMGQAADADQKTEEAKAPGDKFNEAKDAIVIGEIPTMLGKDITPKMNAVFGQTKITGFSNGYMGTTGSFLVMYKIPRVASAQDLNNLVKQFTDNGYVSINSGTDGTAVNVMLQKGEDVLTISYDSGSDDQQISIMFIKAMTQ